MTATTSGPLPSDEQLLSMYERMLLVRRMEGTAERGLRRRQAAGCRDLYIGQEAVAVGVCAHLTDRDWITSTHRGHGHFLAKGGDPGAMMAEIWGKRTGICQGMGGSMHVADIGKGILGANGIVAGGLAIATGAAFGATLDGAIDGGGRVAVAFFGDGAANQGVFMETLNVSTLWRLPVVFVCEYNYFSEFTPSETVTAGEISDRARAFGMPCAVVDGNDVAEVWRAAGEAVDRARDGGGPSFIEARTYRIQGHLEAEAVILDSTYRDEAEIEQWRRRDPIDRLRGRLSAAGACDDAGFAEIESRVSGTVADAAAFAEESEPADPELAFDLMFVGQQP